MRLLPQTTALLAGGAALLLATAWVRPPERGNAPPPGSPAELEGIYARFDSLQTDLTDYRWPVAEELQTTSVFGDYRSTHFHGGVDVSTQGREGAPVRAMRDGYVSLVRISPHGYGNVVEVTHADGFTTWYAHLHNFSPSLDSLIRPRQLATGSPAAEFRPVPNEVSVHRGDVIAFTGSTGAGGPHFHFEIRDAEGNPINPLLAGDVGRRAVDQVAPTFEELGVVPLTAGTLIQGDSKPWYVRPRSSRLASIDPVIRITGDAGLTVRVRDGVGPREFRNRMASLELQLDGKPLYASTITRVPAENSKQIALHYDWSARSHGHPYHQKLFVDEGNRLPFYSRIPEGSGILHSNEILDGLHRLDVIARDLNGNESRLRASVVFNHPPRIDAVRELGEVVVSSPDPLSLRRILVDRSSDGTNFSRVATLLPEQDATTAGTWHVPAPTGNAFVRITAENRFGTPSDPVLLGGGTTGRSTEVLTLDPEFYRDYVYVHIRSSRPLASTPRVKVMAEGETPEPEVRRLTSTHFFTTFALDPGLGRSVTIEATAEERSTSWHGTQELTFAPVTPASGGIAELPDGSFRLFFGPSGVLSNMFIRLQGGGSEVNVLPSDALLDEGAHVHMTVPTELISRRVGLFLKNDGDYQLLDWRKPFGRTRLEGHVSRFLGAFRMVEDETPPRLERRSLSYRSAVLTMDFRLLDERSGIASSSIRVSVDGRPVIAAYDPERRRLSVSERIELSRGRHTIEVIARDRMENEARWRGNFVKYAWGVGGKYR